MIEPVEIESVARASYGRLLALLAAQTRDIPAAEDALADAFERALASWRSGVPDNPEAWLLTVARNRLRDLYKSAAFRTTAPLADTAFDQDIDMDAIPDKRLELLFVCAHPSVEPGIRTPLMLQTVLGFEAAEIAAAFAVPPATMAQRLVRAKRRIKESGIRFEVPTVHDMPARLPAVLEAVYGCYAIDWQLASEATLRDSLAAESLYLATTLAELLATEPEAFGLAALISLSMSRTGARLVDGRHVPLDEQDTTRWDARLIAAGEQLLRQAHALGAPVGRFQLEAAIQSVHADRSRAGTTDWAALRSLHAALVAVSPTLGSRVALAAVVGEDDPAAGLAMLDDLPADDFQPAWATRAHLLELQGRDPAEAYARAIALTTDPAVREYLHERANADR